MSMDNVYTLRGCFTERAKLSAMILMTLADGALDDVLRIKGKKY
ncbi:hypothetical protein [Marinobacterium rhizophilum]|nr:hypothetical protein [Marinobacterium rhizophilum]